MQHYALYDDLNTISVKCILPKSLHRYVLVFLAYCAMMVECCEILQISLMHVVKISRIFILFGNVSHRNVLYGIQGKECAYKYMHTSIDNIAMLWSLGQF